MEAMGLRAPGEKIPEARQGGGLREHPAKCLPVKKNWSGARLRVGRAGTSL